MGGKRSFLSIARILVSIACMLSAAAFAGIKTDTLVVGGASNYTVIEKDGTLRFIGNATTWEDANYAAISLGTGATAPDPITLGAGAITVRAFDRNVTSEQLFGSIEIPHAAILLDSVYYHVHWCPTTADTGRVIWNLTYVMYASGDTLKSDTVISVTSISPAKAWKSALASFPGIYHAALGNQLSYRFWRNPTTAGDTYPADAAVFTIGIHYKSNMTGSRLIDTK